MNSSPKTRNTTSFSIAAGLMLLFLAPVNYTGFSIGPVYFTITRFYIFLLFIPALLLFFGRGKIRHYDILFILFSVWTALCILINRGFSVGLTTAGSFFVESVGVYFIIVGSLNSVQRIYTFMKLWMFIVFVISPFAIIEAFFHFQLFDHIMAAITGNYQYTDNINAIRFGLRRVNTLFRHVILHGVFCSAFIAFIFYIYKNQFRRFKNMVFISFIAALSVSSGPFVGIAFQWIATLVESTTRRKKSRFFIILYAAAVPLTALVSIADRGFFALVDLITYNSHNAYIRKLLWEIGIRDVLGSPFFGINPETWSAPFYMTGSIDNFWLFQMMLGGLPSVFFLFLMLFFLMRKLFIFDPVRVGDDLDGLRRAWTFSMVAIALVGATVHLFENARVLFIIVVSIGAAIMRLIEENENRELTRDAPGGCESSSSVKR